MPISYSEKIIKYGHILIDESVEMKEEHFLRLKLVEYESKLFYQKMIDGKEIEMTKIKDLLSSEED